MAVMLLVAVGFARLGVWQLVAAQGAPGGERRDRRGASRGRRCGSPRPRPAPTRCVSTGSWRRDGTTTAREIVSGARCFEGVPGVRIVTPLLLAEGGPAVLVDRGFLPAPDAVSVDLRGTEEPGVRAVRGIALPIGTAPGEPVEHAGRTTWRRLDLAALRRAAAVRRAAGVHRAESRTARCRGSLGGLSRRRSTRARTWATRSSGSCSRGWRRRSRCWWWGGRGSGMRCRATSEVHAARSGRRHPPRTSASLRRAARSSSSTARARAGAARRSPRPGAARAADSARRAS